MTKNSTRLSLGSWGFLTKCLIIATLMVVLNFLWEGHKGFDLSDEGYLWYGVLQVLQGGVPIRDFMAYDPGRYYWSAALVQLGSHHGDIISLRVAVAAFQWCGLVVGLWLVGRDGPQGRGRGTLFLLGSALLLTMWAYPYYKKFDISLSIFLVGILCYLISNPKPVRYFLAGVAVGLIAFFGRNHGVYAVIASLGVMVWLSLHCHQSVGLLKRGLFWGGGVIVGFSPMLLMIMLVPGFEEAFWASIQALVKIKSVNALPTPWPWRVQFAGEHAGHIIRHLLIGLFFLVEPVTAFLAALWVTARRWLGRPVSPVLVAAAFACVPYIHYAFTRADLLHLTHSLSPWLIGVLVLAGQARWKLRWAVVVVLLLVSGQTVLRVHPGWECRASTKWCVATEISGERIWVDRMTGDNIAMIHKLNDVYAPAGQSFFATDWPGAYAILGRKSPTWEIYALFPQSRAFEDKEIERLKAARPAFVVIRDEALDGREELRYENTHPLTAAYIRDSFTFVPYPGYEGNKIYRAGESAD